MHQRFTIGALQGVLNSQDQRFFADQPTSPKAHRAHATTDQIRVSVTQFFTLAVKACLLPLVSKCE